MNHEQITCWQIQSDRRVTCLASYWTYCMYRRTIRAQAVWLATSSSTTSSVHMIQSCFSPTALLFNSYRGAARNTAQTATSMTLLRKAASWLSSVERIANCHLLNFVCLPSFLKCVMRLTIKDIMLQIIIGTHMTDSVVLCTHKHQTNTLIRKLLMCSVQATTKVLKACCTPVCTADSWRRYRNSNDGMMEPWPKVPRWSRASQSFVSVPCAHLFCCTA